jgi:hypothetical protein
MNPVNLACPELVEGVNPVKNLDRIHMIYRIEKGINRSGRACDFSLSSLP